MPRTLLARVNPLFARRRPSAGAPSGSSLNWVTLIRGHATGVPSASGPAWTARSAVTWGAHGERKRLTTTCRLGSPCAARVTTGGTPAARQGHQLSSLRVLSRRAFGQRRVFAAETSAGGLRRLPCPLPCDIGWWRDCGRRAPAAIPRFLAATSWLRLLVTAVPNALAERARRAQNRNGPPAALRAVQRTGSHRHK